MTLAKLSNENDREYIWRLCQAKTSGLLDVSWDELANILNKELKDEENYLSKDSYRKPFENAKLWYQDVFSKMIDTE